MASLLPNEFADFGSPDYWEHFFSKMNTAFEWYGDFNELSSIFLENIKRQDIVLEIGCGNSQLSCQIYDQIGCQRMLGIDTSEKAITQVRQLYADSKLRPGLSYEKIDVFVLDSELSRFTPPISGFNCVIDKGTLDAIHSGGFSEEQICRYFDQISSALNIFGRYILITLAQEHIVRSIGNYFLRARSEWILTCTQMTRPTPVQVPGAEFSLPVFSFVLVKMRCGSNLPQLRCKGINEEKVTRIDCENSDCLPSSLFNWVKHCQQECVLHNIIKSKTSCKFHLVNASSDVPLFFCEVVLKKPSRSDVSNLQGVFLVPYAKNTAEEFVGVSGQQVLLKSLGLQSALFVITNPSIWFASLDVAKTCLSAALASSPLALLVKSLPIYCTSDGFPSLTAAVDHTPFTVLSTVACNNCVISSCLDPVGVYLAHTSHLCKAAFSSVSRPALNHLIAWLAITSVVPKSDPQRSSVYFGLPPCLPLGLCSGLTIHLDSFACSGIPCYSRSLRKCLNQLFPPSLPILRNEKKKGKSKGVSGGCTLSANCSVEDGLSFAPEGTYCMIYDPWILGISDYLTNLSNWSLAKFVSLAADHLCPGGFAVVMIRPPLDASLQLEHDARGIATQWVLGTPGLSILSSYEIPCELKGETPVSIVAFRKSSGDSEAFNFKRLLVSLQEMSDEEYCTQCISASRNETTLENLPLLSSSKILKKLILSSKSALTTIPDYVKCAPKI